MDAVLNAIGGVYNAVVASPVGVYVAGVAVKTGELIHQIIPIIKF